MSSSIEDLLELALENYQDALFGYAYNLLSNRENARDVVQDVFLRLCQQKPAKVEGHLKAWLFTVCRNRCYDILRKENKRKFTDPEVLDSLPDQSQNPAELNMAKESHAKILGYLDRLTDNQREVILLKFQSGMTYKEIQEVTGLSQSNIGFIIHTGLKKIREWVDEI